MASGARVRAFIDGSRLSERTAPARKSEKTFSVLETDSNGRSSLSGVYKARIPCRAASKAASKWAQEGARRIVITNTATAKAHAYTIERVELTAEHIESDAFLRDLCAARSAQGKTYIKNRLKISPAPVTDEERQLCKTLVERAVRPAESRQSRTAPARSTNSGFTRFREAAQEMGHLRGGSNQIPQRGTEEHSNLVKRMQEKMLDGAAAPT